MCLLGNYNDACDTVLVRWLAVWLINIRRTSLVGWFGFSLKLQFSVKMQFSLKRNVF
jgi:hypothetical protein